MARRKHGVFDARTKLLGSCLALGLLLVCIPSSVKTSAQARKDKEECVPTRDPRILESRQNKLRATAENLLRAFRSGDTKTFLTLVHPDYFSIGVEEGKNYTLSELEQAFRTRKEIYCYLFDASCIPPPSPNSIGVATSFREVAKRPEARVESVQLWSGTGVSKPGCRGSVSFRWADPVGLIDASTFAFMYVDGEWKTVGFAFPAAFSPSAPGIVPQETPK